MVEQIEMSTAEAPAQNAFCQTFNFFGRAIPMRSTFTFGSIQPTINRNDEKTNNSSNSKGNDVITRKVEVNTTWMPYNEAMANSSDRAATFLPWPRQIIQKPDQMVSSGFYYTGHGDVVQCFYCGISLKHWSCTDTVDVEHQRHSPSCKFLVTVHRK